MEIVLLTALGVGGATVIGAVIVFIFKKISSKFTDVILSFAAGVMLSASVYGLISHSLEDGGDYALLIVVLGIFAGAVCVNLADRLVPSLHKVVGAEPGLENSRQLSRVILMILAISIHNLPEGISAGVSFGSGDLSHALLIAFSIALHNIPEGMIVVGPMIAAGVSSARAFLCAILIGSIEVLGTFIGYLAVGISSAILPFALAFAGGTMLYVIITEMIPEVQSGGKKNTATYAFLVGFCFMLVMHEVLAH